MKRSLFAILAFCLVYLLQLTTLQRCATPTSPTGGARDTIGPVLIPEETTPNFQTDFRPEEIVLTFDEWVELDPQQQIIISPPLELGEDNRPRLRRRSLVIPLTGLELLDSVTYVVNVGSAIKDLNEGNPTENLRFVFATGPVLDSASVSGTLVEDFSGKPVEDATFTLYSNLADTAAFTENPTYFAQTDEEGRFTVYNLRPGRYRAVALLRNPSATNYFYDLAGYAQPQSVGFIDTVITVVDGTNTVGTVRLSPIPRPIRINNLDSTEIGLLRLVLNQPAAGVDVAYGGEYLRRDVRDTVKLYYREMRPDTFVVGRDTLREDTLIYFGDGTPVAVPLAREKGPSGRINPTEGLEFIFNRPLERVDTSRIGLYRDSLSRREPFTVELDSVYPGIVHFQTNWVPGARYRLEILPTALTDWAGISNQDTIASVLTADGPEKYGTLTLSLTNLDTTTAYILRLVEKEKPLPATERYVQNRATYSVTYRGLKPATYQVEIITDTNGNRRYDAGDFLRYRQPELIRRFPVEALRADWEVEENIDLEE